MTDQKLKVHYIRDYNAIPKNVLIRTLLLGKTERSDLNVYTDCVWEETINIPKHLSDIDFLDEIYNKFNSFSDNPLGASKNPAKQEYLKDKRLHTSMSVGDVVQIDDKYWVIRGSGFAQI